jgi:hypothetical protein
MHGEDFEPRCGGGVSYPIITRVPNLYHNRNDLPSRNIEIKMCIASREKTFLGYHGL